MLRTATLFLAFIISAALCAPIDVGGDHSGGAIDAAILAFSPNATLPALSVPFARPELPAYFEGFKEVMWVVGENGAIIPRHLASYSASESPDTNYTLGRRSGVDCNWIENRHPYEWVGHYDVVDETYYACQGCTGTDSITRSFGWEVSASVNAGGGLIGVGFSASYSESTTVTCNKASHARVVCIRSTFHKERHSGWAWELDCNICTRLCHRNGHQKFISGDVYRERPGDWCDNRDDTLC